MPLNIINPFKTPCNITLPGSPQSNNSLTSLYDAARVMACRGSNAEIANHIEDELENGSEFQAWRAAMSAPSSQILDDYQNNYHKNINFATVNSDILKYGVLLPDSQILFHGGNWKGLPTAMTTCRPLSTTFCPQVAMREAENCGKAYKAGYIDLLYIKLDNPVTKAFVYAQSGTAQAHEKEVLFATGAKIKIGNRTRINRNYPTSEPNKTIISYLVEITLS